MRQAVINSDPVANGGSFTIKFNQNWQLHQLVLVGTAETGVGVINDPEFVGSIQKTPFRSEQVEIANVIGSWSLIKTGFTFSSRFNYVCYGYELPAGTYSIVANCRTSGVVFSNFQVQIFFDFLVNQEP